MLEFNLKNKSLKPNDERAIIGIESCTFAMEALENPSRYELVPFQHNTIRKNMHPVLQTKIMMNCFLHLPEMAL